RGGAAGGDRGAWQVASPAIVEFGGARKLSSTSTVSGTGTLKISGTVSPNGGGVSVAKIVLGGALDGPGVMTVPAGSVVVFSGQINNGARLLNKGSLTVQGAASVSYNGVLENAG